MSRAIEVLTSAARALGVVLVICALALMLATPVTADDGAVDGFGPQSLFQKAY